ncbi:uncharacterized protein LOC133293137 [Gastrolobium bilobum]|uniref:uncharacterized protein LOC133293137 n=1 Tax=Gastrolobium bilobum TaxID=150636 RepID=UPI002AB098F1|nr:uncharacterized protein LOC133293137 [Gastrolobium bilobum]
MLGRGSFKSSKCKTALKLAISRIKLLKNKREAHVKQLRKELAQLLQSPHNYAAARVQVEQVVTEEKKMVAYDLIQIYCELITARLPVIESQKYCPIDLKEAISSVIFASTRCLDIPELMDVRKQIKAKYGKELVSAALELRPDCGVNHLLVEKLSAKAPDGPTKIKILSAIAEEHNVKWQPSLEENDVNSSHDLLVGPNTFEKATYVEPPQLHVPHIRDEKGPPDFRASYQLKEIHDISSNSCEQNAFFAARKTGGDQSTKSDRSSPEIRPSGTGSQEMDFRDSYPESMSAFPMNRQNWNMEFKDAVSAAQAAVESAERASMAARAALELSNREKLTRQYSSGSQSSSGSGFRGEIPQEYTFHADKHLSTGSVNSTFNLREYCTNSNENVVKRNHPASLTSNTSFRDDNPFPNVSGMAEIYTHNNLQEAKTSTNNPHIKKGKSEANKKPSSRASNAYLDSDTSDSEDGLPKQNLVSLTCPVGGFSVRTFVPSKTGTRISLKDDALSKASKTVGTGLGWKPSRVSYESKNQKAFKVSYENGSAENVASKPGSEPKNMSSSEEIIISSPRVQPSSSPPKLMIPYSEEASKSLNSHGDIPSVEKSCHVHPKLPDCDSFLAYFLSLKGPQ